MQNPSFNDSKTPQVMNVTSLCYSCSEPFPKQLLVMSARLTGEHILFIIQPGTPYWKFSYWRTHKLFSGSSPFWFISSHDKNQHQHLPWPSTQQDCNLWNRSFSSGQTLFVYFAVQVCKSLQEKYEVDADKWKWISKSTYSMCSLSILEMWQMISLRRTM